MTLLITASINTNSETLSLAQALVLIENNTQQTQFIKHLKQAFNNVKAKGFIIMSDREKGLLGVLDKVVPDAV